MTTQAQRMQSRVVELLLILTLESGLVHQHWLLCSGPSIGEPLDN